MLRGEGADAGAPATASWTALGTTVVLRVSDPGALGHARAAVEAQLAAIDLACSRFREDSELSRVNARAGQTVRVGPLLIEALGVALRAAQLTEGDVDPTVGRALEIAGYDRDWQALLEAPKQGAPAPRLTVRVRPAWRAVQLDREHSRVRIPRGVRLDLGASAKAWVADRSAAAAATAAGCAALVAVGGDLATCGAAPGRGWLVHVTDDHRSAPTAPGQTVRIRVGGLATSSTAVRRWRNAGQEMHHIIDPRSGAPARSPWRTVSVAAEDCTQANIAATAAIVRGRAALPWLQRLGLPARLVEHGGRVRCLGGWPAQQDAPGATTTAPGAGQPGRRAA
jgi:FAD:protein FMN transferase